MREQYDVSMNEVTARLQGWMQLYGADVLHLAYSYVHNHHLAQDLTQDVFLRALTKMDSFREQSSARTWLLSITANRCKDYLRSWTAKHEVPDAERTYLDASSQNIESEIEVKLERDALWQTVSKLPLKYREVVILYYQRDLTGQEIAQILGITEQTVRTRLHRGRALLKDVLQKGGLWDEKNGR